MNNDRLLLLADEITRFRTEGRYLDCIQQMELYAKNERDPKALFVIFLAKATCCLQLGNISGADQALSAIDRRKLSEADRLYYDLPFVDLLREQNKGAVARKILESDLKIGILSLPEYRDAHSGILARLGILLAEAEEFNAAINYLEDSIRILENDPELEDTVCIYLGFCYQSIGKFDAAKRFFARPLNSGSGLLTADAYYRLGGLYLEQRNYDLAIDMFTRAEDHLPMGRIRLGDILIAKSDAYRASGKIDLANETEKRSKLEKIIQ